MTLKTDFSRYDGATPGPWYEDADTGYIGHPEYGCVCWAGDGNSDRGDKSLIADAPRLAARLKAWEEWYEALDKRHDADWGEADVEETSKALDAAKLALMEAYK